MSCFCQERPWGQWDLQFSWWNQCEHDHLETADSVGLCSMVPLWRHQSHALLENPEIFLGDFTSYKLPVDACFSRVFPKCAICSHTFSQNFPMIFQWYSYVPMIFQWTSHIFPWISHDFPTCFMMFPHFPMNFLVPNQVQQVLEHQPRLALHEVQEPRRVVFSG